MESSPLGLSIKCITQLTRPNTLRMLQTVGDESIKEKTTGGTPNLSELPNINYDVCLEVLAQLKTNQHNGVLEGSLSMD